MHRSRQLLSLMLLSIFFRHSGSKFTLNITSIPPPIFENSEMLAITADSTLSIECEVSKDHWPKAYATRFDMGIQEGRFHKCFPKEASAAELSVGYLLTDTQGFAQEDYKLGKREECRRMKSGTDYRGTKSTTNSGKTCRMWKDCTAENYNPSKNPHNDLVENFCRNPDGYHSLWCYTVGGGYDSCSVPECLFKQQEACSNCKELRQHYRTYFTTARIGSAWKLKVDTKKSMAKLAARPSYIYSSRYYCASKIMCMSVGDAYAYNPPSKRVFVGLKPRLFLEVKVQENGDYLVRCSGICEWTKCVMELKYSFGRNNGFKKKQTKQTQSGKFPIGNPCLKPEDGDGVDLQKDSNSAFMDFTLNEKIPMCSVRKHLLELPVQHGNFYFANMPSLTVTCSAENHFGKEVVEEKFFTKDTRAGNKNLISIHISYPSRNKNANEKLEWVQLGEKATIRCSSEQPTRYFYIVKRRLIPKGETWRLSESVELVVGQTEQQLKSGAHYLRIARKYIMRTRVTAKDNQKRGIVDPKSTNANMYFHFYPKTDDFGYYECVSAGGGHGTSQPLEQNSAGAFLLAGRKPKINIVVIAFSEDHRHEVTNKILYHKSNLRRGFLVTCHVTFMGNYGSIEVYDGEVLKKKRKKLLFSYQTKLSAIVNIRSKHITCLTRNWADEVSGRVQLRVNETDPFGNNRGPKWTPTAREKGPHGTIEKIVPTEATPLP